MVMLTSNDIKNGSVVVVDGQLWQVQEFQHVKPGKGGAFVRTKIKNLTSNKIVDKTWNAGAKLEFASVDRCEYQYLYRDADEYIFMDLTTFDQVIVPASVVGDAANFLLENETASIAISDVTPLYLELPASVTLEITYTVTGLQVDRSSVCSKPVTLETGYSILFQVFLNGRYKFRVIL